MRSSPASVASSLELPAVTLADRAAAALVLMAGTFVAWQLGCQDAVSAAWLAGLAGIVGASIALRRQNHSRMEPPIFLARRADGTLWVHRDGQAPVPARLGGRSRLLGPSVFLDLTFANTEKSERVLRWITPCDAPADILRHWTVVLPRTGRKASS